MLGDGQAEADEHRGSEAGDARGFEAGVHQEVPAWLELAPGAAGHDHERGRPLDHSGVTQRDALEKRHGAGGGLETIALELGRDILRGKPAAASSRLPPFHELIGQRSHMGGDPIRLDRADRARSVADCLTPGLGSGGADNHDRGEERRGFGP